MEATIKGMAETANGYVFTVTWPEEMKESQEISIAKMPMQNVEAVIGSVRGEIENRLKWLIVEQTTGKQLLEMIENKDPSLTVTVKAEDVISDIGKIG